MNRIRGLVFVVVGSAVGYGLDSPGQAALIGHWTFDDPANLYADSSGFANHGVRAGTGTLTQVAGKVGSGAIQFPGSVWLNVGSNDIFDTQTYTVSAWVYKDPAATGWRGVAGNWGGIPTSSWMHLGQHSSGTFSNHVKIDGFQKDMVGTSSVKSQEWQHLVSVVDKANKRLQLWVDGTLEFETTLTTWGSTAVPGTSDLSIGTSYQTGNSNCASMSWIGQIDDVAIWNRALTASEIQTLNTKGLQGVNAASAVLSVPVEKGLQLWLDASDASTIIPDVGGGVKEWRDKSGNNHATQTDTTRQPVLNTTAMNGRPAIRFDGGADGAADGLVIADGLNLNARPYTVFIVDQYYGSPYGRTLQGRDANWLVGKHNGNNSHWANGWVGYVATGDNIPAISDAQGYSYGSGYFLDGIDRTGASEGGSSPMGNPGKLALNASGSVNEPSKSDVAEVLVFKRALSFHERSLVGQYLREKYGLTGYTGYNTHLATREWVFFGADPGEGLDFQGRFVYAANIGGPGGAQVGDARFTTDTGLITAENQISNWFSPNYGTSTNDLNLATVMQSIRWTQTGNGGIEDITITLPGLEIGRTYKLQLLLKDNYPSRHFAVDINGSRVIGDLPPGGIQGIITGEDISARTQGTVLVHQFVADRPTMTIVLNGQPVSGGDRNPMINALTLEDLGVTGQTRISTFTGGDPGEGLDVQGTFLYAVNVGGPGGLQGLQVGDARFTADTDTPGLKINAENHAPNWSTPNYGSSPNDIALASLMQSARWTDTHNPQNTLSRGEAVNLELSGLSPGQQYVLQLLFGDTGSGRGFDVVIEDTLVLDNFNPAASGASGNVGVVVTHQFHATDSLLHIVLDGYPTSFTTPNPMLFAFTLEVVPEPSTCVLLGIGLVGLTLVGVRKRRKWNGGERAEG